MLSRTACLLVLAASLAGPAAAQERQWMLDANGDEAYLIFGVPDSDDVGISFWCKIASGEINIYVPGTQAALEAGKPVTIRLTVDAEAVDIPGTVEVNAEAGVTSAQGKLDAGAAVFSALQEADRFRVGLAETENIYPLIDAEVGTLLRLCRKP